MQTVIELVNDLSRTWIALTLAVVWQSTVIGLLIALIAGWLPKSSPALRYWLWQILAVKLLLMPCWVLAVPLPMFYSDMIPEGPAGDTSSRPVVELLSGDGSIGHGLTVTGEAPAVPPAAWILLSWQAWLVVLWLVVVIVQVSRIVYQRLRLRRLLRGAAAASEKLTALTEQLASQVGLRHTPAMLVTKRDVSPFVCGVLRPRIVLPQDLHRTLNNEQLQQVILHELSHLKRGDLVWGWFRRLLGSFTSSIPWFTG